MEKIALVVPKSYNPKKTYREYPLGVGYIGTVLKEAGYKVKIFDQNLEFRNTKVLVEKLKKYNPYIIGFSIMTPTYPAAKEIVKLLKKEGDNSYLIAGGIHPTLFPIDLIEDSFDIVIKGEGEQIITKLVKKLKNGSDLKNIPNIVYKTKDKIVENSKVIFPENINNLPFIDRSLYNLELYSHHSMVGSRGCPNECKFCCNYSKLMLKENFFIRCPQDVIKEMVYIKEKYGVKNIFL